MAPTWLVLSAAAISALGTLLHITLARRSHRLQASPREDRWHSIPTPTMGGLSMMAATLIAVALEPATPRMTWVILFFASAMGALGLLDDVFRLKPYIKLGGQLIIASLAVYSGLHLGLGQGPLWLTLLSVLWLVGLTNAFNLMDNMDGLAGGTALIATIFLTLYHDLPQTLGVMPWVLAVAILGFLIFNWNPAKIFMGDCGSHFLGFTVAALSMLGTWQGTSGLLLLLLMPILILTVPIFDTLLVSIQRKIHGLPISMGGKDHSSHRLVALGLSEKKTVLTLWGVSLVCGGLALLGKRWDAHLLTLALSLLLLFTLLMGVVLSGAKIYEVYPPQTPQIRRVLPTRLFFKRRMVDILIDTLIILAAYILSYLLRYDWQLDLYAKIQLHQTIYFVLATKLFVLIVMGLYEGYWSYITFNHVLRILRASLLSSVGVVLVILAFFRFEGFSRTLFAIDFVLCFLMLVGSRAMLRWLRETFVHLPQDGLRIGIVGDGLAAEYVYREVSQHPEWNLKCAGLITVSQEGSHFKSPDFPYLGHIGQLADLITQQRLHKVIVADSLEASEESHIRKTCEALGVACSPLQPLGPSLLKIVSR